MYSASIRHDKCLYLYHAYIGHGYSSTHFSLLIVRPDVLLLHIIKYCQYLSLPQSRPAHLHISYCNLCYTHCVTSISANSMLLLKMMHS